MWAQLGNVKIRRSSEILLDIIDSLNVPFY